jgi:hypothetical protein
MEEEDEEEEVESQEEEEELEVESENEGDLGDEYDLSQYDKLVGKPHYDPDDDAVYKCSNVAVVDGNVVVYRCKYNSISQKWGKVNMKDPIHIGDILSYHGDPNNEKEVNDRLHERNQRGRKK